MSENKLDRVLGWLTKLRLQARISLLVTLGLVLLFYFMAWQGARQIDTVIQLTLQERLILVRTVARDLDHDLEHTLGDLAQVATFPAFNLEDGDMEPEKAELRALHPQSFSYVFLLDKDGLVLWTEPYLPEVVGRQRLECPQVLEALRVGQPAIACLSHALIPQAPAIAPVVPIKNKDGSTVGILGAAIDPSSPAFSDLLRPVAPGRTGYAQLVDENGLVLAHTEGRNLHQRSEHADLFISMLKEKKAAVVTQSVIEEGKGAFREVIAFAPLSQAPWGVAVEQAEAELLAPTLELRNRMILFAAMALAAALLLVWATTLTVTRPVRRLIAASGRIAAGDLATPVPSLGEDEIGELGRRFEEMRVRLARWGEELETAVQKRARQISVLYAIDRASAQSLNPDKILNDALDKIIAVLEVEAGGIYLLEPNRETMTLRVHRGLSDEFVESVRRIKLGEGVSGRAVAEKKPVVLDMAGYPTERLAPYIVREGFQTLASTPLLSRGEPVGALSLGTRRPRAFPPEELDLLMALGQQLGQTVANARLYQETQQHLDELANLREAAMTVAGELELPRVLDRIVEKAASSLGVPFSAIFLLDEASGLIHLRATHGLSERYFREMQPVPLGLGLVGRAAAQRQPIVSEDLENEPRMQPLPQNLRVALEEGIRSVLVVPMLTKGKVVGTLSVYARTCQGFDPEQIPLLSTFADHAAVAVENAQLFQQAQERAERLALLNRIARALSTTLNLNELLETVYREITDVIEADVFFIALYDRAVNELDFRIRIDKGVREPPERRPLSTGLTGLVVTSKQPVLVRDFEKEKEHLPPVKLWGTMQAPPSWLGVPMRLGDNVVGVISVQAYRPNAYGDAEQALLATIADAVAVAIENARLYAQTQQRLAELSTLFEVSAALRGATTVEAMLPLILDRTIDVMRADAGDIYLLDEAKGDLVCRAASERLKALRSIRLQRGEGITGYVMETSQPYVTPDLISDPKFPARAELRAAFQGLHGNLSVPLKTGAAVIGAMHLSSLTARTFTESELRLLVAIADMAASAIHRASLFEELEHRIHELSALFDMSKMATATLRIQDVLGFVVGAAIEALHAEGAYLFLWDEREERLVMRAAHGLSPGQEGQVKYRLGEGLSGRVFLESRLANVPDVAADPRWKREPDKEATHPSGRVISALVVPLIVGVKTMGVLGVVNKIGLPAFAQSDEAFLTALASQAAIAIENARLYEDVRSLSITTVRSLATAIDGRDPYMRGHSDAVARLAVRLGRELGWSGADQEMLEFAALLHDVGKITIPDTILHKVEPLTPDAWNIIRLHPYHSAQIIKPVEPLQRVVPWIYHHHEWWDGTGYPDGLKGTDIPLAARIIAVADAFNAMTTGRPYRVARSVAEALAEMQRCAGRQFDSAMVGAFLRVIGQ
jgi:putative nucleotidyltransferase with HDIG domain